MGATMGAPRGTVCARQASRAAHVSKEWAQGLCSTSSRAGSILVVRQESTGIGGIQTGQTAGLPRRG